MKKITILITFLFFAFNSIGQELVFCHTNKIKDDTLINLHYYKVCYSKNNRGPYYSSFYVTKSRVVKKAERKDNFRPDTSLRKEIRACLNNYKVYGYDRGHLCNVEAMQFSFNAQDTTFLLENIALQNKYLNRGVWKSLENLINKQVIEYDTIFVVAGVVYDSLSKFDIYSNLMPIPIYFWKVVYIDKFYFCYLFPNKECSRNYMDYRVDLLEFERVTGFRIENK